MSGELPALLDYGILLEDSGTLLAWNSTRDELRNMAQPQILEQSGHRLGLVWRNRRWMNGLTVTFGASLKATERLRRVEMWPVGLSAADFGRFARELATRLGAATQSSDAPGAASRFWRRQHLDLQLRVRAQSEIAAVFSFHGPEPRSAPAAASGSNGFEPHLVRLGLTLRQWHDLKNYLLDLRAGIAAVPPSGLEAHAVTVLALDYVRTHELRHLDQAAARLAGTGSQAWLMLDKS